MFNYSISVNGRSFGGSFGGDGGIAEAHRRIAMAQRQGDMMRQAQQAPAHHPVPVVTPAPVAAPSASSQGVTSTAPSTLKEYQETFAAVTATAESSTATFATSSSSEVDFTPSAPSAPSTEVDKEGWTKNTMPPVDTRTCLADPVGRSEFADGAVRKAVEESVKLRATTILSDAMGLPGNLLYSFMKIEEKLSTRATPVEDKTCSDLGGDAMGAAISGKRLFDTVNKPK